MKTNKHQSVICFLDSWGRFYADPNLTRRVSIQIEIGTTVLMYRQFFGELEGLVTDHETGRSTIVCDRIHY